MAAPLYTTASGLYYHAGKILVLAVGLPARGKTHMSRALERYLRWMGIKTQVVSLGDYRRRALGGAQNVPKDYFTLGKKSPETEKLRAEINEGCERVILDSFEKGVQVVIYDANNGSIARRQRVAEKFDKQGIHVLVLESLCDNPSIVEANIRSVKISSPDYKGWDPEKAVADYWDRIKDQEKYYQTVTETTWPYIKIHNVGEKIEVNNIQGYLQSRIVFFLMNIHNQFRTIYFARSGQSLIEHSYKADSDLSPAGWEYAERLREFVAERRAENLASRGLDANTRKLVIWTSARRRAAHTAWPFTNPAASHQIFPVSAMPEPSAKPATKKALPSSSSLKESFSAADLEIEDENSVPTPPLLDLDNSNPHVEEHSNSEVPSAIPPHLVKVVEKPQMSEINPGIWDGLSPNQVRKQYPGEWEQFVKDPYSFRCRRAESYHDLSVRLEPILVELEKQKEDLLIIGHASVIRCLLAYLIGLPSTEVPAVEIARGDLIEVVPTSYGVTTNAYHFWDGPDRKQDSTNFYENYAEDTAAKRKLPVIGQTA